MSSCLDVTLSCTDRSLHEAFAGSAGRRNEPAVEGRYAKSAAQEVRSFYESIPYPPPIDNLEKYRLCAEPQKRRAEFHLLWPSRPFGEDLSILVADCGTSQAAKHAMRWPAARVTGID